MLILFSEILFNLVYLIEFFCPLFSVYKIIFTINRDGLASSLPLGCSIFLSLHSFCHRNSVWKERRVPCFCLSCSELEVTLTTDLI